MKAAGYIDSITGLPRFGFSRLTEALKQAFEHDGPVVVDVRTAKQELSMLPKIEAKQARGFSLYMLWAVMNGRGDEVVDLGRTNWWGR